jgi:hypothetical protein
VDKSDISQVFEVIDTYTSLEGSTAFEGQELEEENDYPFLGSELSFLKLRSCKFWGSRFCCDGTIPKRRCWGGE